MHSRINFDIIQRLIIVIQLWDGANRNGPPPPNKISITDFSAQAQQLLHNAIHLSHGTRVLLEKLKGFQLVKKFPPFYGTGRFIAAFATEHHLALSSARSIGSVPAHLILSFQVASFFQVSPPKPRMHFSSPHTCYISSPSH